MSFFGGNDFGGSRKTKIWRYFFGGNAIRRQIFGPRRFRHFLAVTTLAEAEIPKYGGIFSAVMQYGGNFFAVRGFSFFGGNVNVNSKLGGNCGA